MFINTNDVSISNATDINSKSYWNKESGTQIGHNRHSSLVNTLCACCTQSGQKNAKNKSVKQKRKNRKKRKQIPISATTYIIFVKAHSSRLSCEGFVLFRCAKQKKIWIYLSEKDKSKHTTVDQLCQCRITRTASISAIIVIYAISRKYSHVDCIKSTLIKISNSRRLFSKIKITWKWVFILIVI